LLLWCHFYIKRYTVNFAFRPITRWVVNATPRHYLYITLYKHLCGVLIQALLFWWDSYRYVVAFQ
jgi:hypothetical protein